MLDCFLAHGASPGAGLLEELGRRLRLLRPDLGPGHRAPDGLRRQLVAFKVLADRHSTVDTKCAEAANRVWARRLARRDAEGGRSGTMARPSRGPNPAFGPSHVERWDGWGELYLMCLSGPVECVFDEQPLLGRKVAKVGWSNDARRRLAEMNDGFPPGLAIRWELVETRRYRSGASAYAAEQDLLARLDDEGASLGREFVLLSEGDVRGMLSRHVLEPW